MNLSSQFLILLLKIELELYTVAYFKLSATLQDCVLPCSSRLVTIHGVHAWRRLASCMHKTMYNCIYMYIYVYMYHVCIWLGRDLTPLVHVKACAPRPAVIPSHWSMWQACGPRRATCLHAPCTNVHTSSGRRGGSRRLPKGQVRVH